MSAIAMTGGPVQLTRRGRLLLLLLFLCAASAALVVVGGQAIGTGDRGEPVPVRIVHVGVGDTLWGIAQQAAPDADPREVIVEVEQLNPQLADGLQVGEAIAVPVTG